MHARLYRLHRVELVVDGRGGAGQVVDFVHLDEQRERDVVADDFEAGVGEEVFDVLLGAGEEVIHADDFAAFLEQAFAEVGSQKPRSARDEDAFSQVHDYPAILARGVKIIAAWGCLDTQSTWRANARDAVVRALS